MGVSNEMFHFLAKIYIFLILRQIMIIIFENF
jgi:hypothetical protein